MAAAAPRATVAARRAAARCARGRVGRGGFRAAAARRRPLAAATGGESGESGEAEGEASPVKNPYGEEMPSWYTEEMRAADEALILQQLAEGTEEKRAAQAERAEFRKQFGDLLGQDGAASEGGDDAAGEEDELDLEDENIAELVEKDEQTGTLTFKAPDKRRRMRRKVREIEAESQLRSIRFPQDQIYEREERYQAGAQTSEVTGGPKTDAERLTEEARRVGLVGGKSASKSAAAAEAEKYVHMFGMTLEQLDAYDDDELEALTASVLKAAKEDEMPLSEAELAELERLEAEAELAEEEEAAMALAAESAAPGAVIEEDAYQVAAREARAVALELAQIADDTKARDLEVVNVGEHLYWCNYWVLLSVTSRPQMDAVAERCRKRAAELGRELAGGRGETRQNSWTLLDFGDVVVHVFTPAAREYYDLEGRYPDAERVELPFASAAQ